jgi:hypothetical protein
MATQITSARLRMPGESGIEFELNLAMVLDAQNPGVTRFRVSINETTHEYKTLGPAMSRFNAEVGQLVLAGASVIGVTKQEGSSNHE